MLGAQIFTIVISSSSSDTEADQSTLNAAGYNLNEVITGILRVLRRHFWYKNKVASLWI